MKNSIGSRATVHTVLAVMAAASVAVGGEGGDGGQSLDSKATDPTAGLMSFAFAEAWTVDYHDLDRMGYAIRFRPVIPFNLWGIGNITRISMQFDHGGVPGYGLEDVQIFDLWILPLMVGRFAIGPLVNLASAISPTPSPFSIGPAIGYDQSTEAVTVGLFNQNFWGDGVGNSSFQPILTWRFANEFDLGFGDLQFTYDWEREEWVSVPLGAQLGYLAMVAQQPIRFYAAPLYNFRDLSGTPRFQAQFGLVFLLP